MYLKLVEDYKAYDVEQKKVIRCLQTDLDFLKFENPEYIKLLRRNSEFKKLQKEVHRLRQENEILISKIAILQKRRNDG